MPDPLRVLLLPSVRYAPLWQAHAAGEHPIPTMPPELLRQAGVVCESIDPGPWPINPFGRMHSFYRAFDPFRLLRALITHRRHDLIVSGNDAAAFALVTARRLLGLRMRVAIWDFSPSETWRARRFAQDRTLPRIDGLLALCRVQEGYVHARWGGHVPVITVGHWVDTAFFRPDAAAPQDGILAVGDDAGRDYPTLLRAVEGVDLSVAIRTDQPLPEAGPAIRRLPRLPATGLRGLYAAARFVVVPLHPDTTNASGVSTVLEAAAMGKAVIVSDSAGIRDFVRHQETALVVPARDPEALRRAIRRLAAEPETCARLGAGGRRFVEAVCAPDVFAPRLAAAYRALAAAAPPRG